MYWVETYVKILYKSWTTTVFKFRSCIIICSKYGNTTSIVGVCASSSIIWECRSGYKHLFTDYRAGYSVHRSGLRRSFRKWVRPSTLTTTKCSPQLVKYFQRGWPHYYSNCPLTKQKCSTEVQYIWKFVLESYPRTKAITTEIFIRKRSVQSAVVLNFFTRKSAVKCAVVKHVKVDYNFVQHQNWKEGCTRVQ